MNGTERKVCPFSLWECERRAFCTCRNIAHARQEQHPYYGNLRPLLPKSDQQTHETTNFCQKNLKPNKEVPNLRNVRPILPKPSPNPSTSKGTNSSQNNDSSIKSTTNIDETNTCEYKPSYKCEVCNCYFSSKGSLSSHIWSDKHLNALKKHKSGLTYFPAGNHGIPQSSASQNDDAIRIKRLLPRKRKSSTNVDKPLSAQEFKNGLCNIGLGKLAFREKYHIPQPSSSKSNDTGVKTLPVTEDIVIDLTDDDDNFAKKSDIAENAEMFPEKNTKEGENEQTATSAEISSFTTMGGGHVQIDNNPNTYCELCNTNWMNNYFLQKHKTETHETLSINPTKDIFPTSSSKPDPAENTPSSSSPLDPRPFYCGDCQIGFRVYGHLAKHLRSKSHFLTMENNRKLPNNLTTASIEISKNVANNVKNIPSPASILPVSEDVVIDLIDDDDFTKNSNVVENEKSEHNKIQANSSSQSNDTTRTTAYTGYCGLCKIAYPINQNTTLVDHFMSNQHKNNVKEKQLKNVLIAQQDESFREATALDTSNISFDYEETTVKQEKVKMEIKEEIPPKSYLLEAGPSNLNADVKTENTQSQELFKCYICDKNFNQYDLEIHFVTDHNSEELL